MRGSPLFHVILVVLGLLGLAVPLSWLTRARTPEAVAPTAGEKLEPSLALTPARVVMKFAHAPATVRLAQGGRELVKEEALAGRTRVKAQTDVELAGGEFKLDVTWPAGTPESAVTLTVEPDGHEAATATVWGAETLGEIIKLEWRP